MLSSDDDDDDNDNDNDDEDESNIFMFEVVPFLLRGLLYGSKLMMKADKVISDPNLDLKNRIIEKN